MNLHLISYILGYYYVKYFFNSILNINLLLQEETIFSVWKNILDFMVFLYLFLKGEKWKRNFNGILFCFWLLKMSAAYFERALSYQVKWMRLLILWKDHLISNKWFGYHVIAYFFKIVKRQLLKQFNFTDLSHSFSGKDLVCLLPGIEKYFPIDN